LPVLQAVVATCAPVSATTSGRDLPSRYRGALYDCAGAAPALAAAG
jgi:hypothetical protein